MAFASAIMSDWHRPDRTQVASSERSVAVRSHADRLASAAASRAAASPTSRVTRCTVDSDSGGGCASVTLPGRGAVAPPPSTTNARPLLPTPPVLLPSSARRLPPLLLPPPVPPPDAAGEVEATAGSGPPPAGGGTPLTSRASGPVGFTVMPTSVTRSTVVDSSMLMRGLFTIPARMVMRSVLGPVGGSPPVGMPSPLKSMLPAW